MPAELVVKDLHVSVENKEILRGVNLTVRQGEVHALMGPNGSGKSTLAYTVAGHPHYKVLSGDVLLNGESILGLQADQRAKAGLFLAFQYPTAIPGVSMANFLRQAVSAVRGYTDRAKAAVAEGGSAGQIGSELVPMREFRKELTEKMDRLHIDASFARRYLNDGFSGGEKKRAEESCRWPCWNRRSPSWTKRTRASTSMPCASWPRASTAWWAPTWAPCSSRTTNGC